MTSPAVPESSDVTVCTPAYGPSPYLRGLIEALNAQTRRPARIIVCHSGAGDPTAWLQTMAGIPIVAIHSDDRLFAGEARNRAAQEANTPWLAFIDSDVVPAPDWLERLLEAAGIYGEKTMIGGSIGYAETGGFWGMSLWISEFSSHHAYVPSRRRHTVGSFTTLIRRDLFEKVGGYPANLYPAEDVGFSSLVEAAGGEVVYHQGPLVAHHNLSGFAHFVDHTRQLAESAAKVRSLFELPGSVAVRHPFLAFPLSWMRLAKVFGRILVYGRGHRRLAVRYAPGLLVFSALYGYHFYRAARRIAMARAPRIAL